MKSNFILFGLCLFLASFFIQAQNFPGGVTGSEVWYIADSTDITEGHFENHSFPITLNACMPEPESGFDYVLFNFNPSLYTDNLCLSYTTSLENDIARNIFFVSEPASDKVSSHVSTGWNMGIVPPPPLHSIMGNTFDLNDQNAYFNKLFAEYHRDKNAHINFYHWNNYDVDKKFRSYGQIGETRFFIGSLTSNQSPDYEDHAFSGSFPEYISFPFELSANEKNRVESYLALKYGITLHGPAPYRSSLNLLLWDNKNYANFPNNIFGMGRDDISNLNQLQSQSVHKKDFLIASIGELMATNHEKQEETQIPDEHFLVFGDNGEPVVLGNTNSVGVKTMQKKWLAQATGEEASNMPVFFHLSLTNEIIDFLNNGLTLWMLRDRFGKNMQVSDFNNYTDYYKAGSLDLNSGVAIFENIFFDPDQSFFDQFTFGVGPEMIVQARVSGCNNTFNTDIIISGGTGPYTIQVKDDISGNTQTYNTPDNIYTLSLSASEYTITVTDNSNGNRAKVTFEIVPMNLIVGLGPDQSLSPSQSQITLDAGEYVTDPDAAYRWYKDGVLLQHYKAVLIVDQPGVYRVEVTSANGSCQESDTIVIDYNIEGQGVQNNSNARPNTTILPNEHNNTPHPQNQASSITKPVAGAVTLTSRIYPNPSDQNAAFYYEVFSEEVFAGKVEVFSLAGSLIYQRKIKGNSKYVLTFNLHSSGTYLIRTITTEGKVKVDKVIIK